MTTDKLVITAVMAIMVMGVGVVTINSRGSAPASAHDKVIEPAVEDAISGYQLRDAPVGIDAIASSPYTRDEYRTTFVKFGNAVSGINSDRLRAAEIGAIHADCDAVANSQITTRSPVKNRRYWVECANLTRLYFDQESLAKGKPVQLQTKADWLRDGLKDW